MVTPVLFQLKEQGGARDVFIEAQLSACGEGKYCSVIFQKHLSISESPRTGPSVVVHTTVTFGSEHLDSDSTEVQQLILSHLERIMPSLPKLASITYQKWRYSQVLCAGGSQLQGCCWGNSIKQTCSLLQETGRYTTQGFSCSGRKGNSCLISVICSST